jgi:hypothetical protein
MRKPVVIGEFGAGTGGEGNTYDPTGVHLHNAIWASVMCGAAGAANIWWWDSYVDPNNLYHHYGSLSKFLDGIELSDAWTPFTTKTFRYLAEAAKVPLTVDIEGNVTSWEKHPANQPAAVTVDPDGTVHAPEQLTALLHGLGGHKDKHNPITFNVNFPRDGEFVVHVTGVSGWGGARLVVRVDGNKMLGQSFKDPDELASKETLHQYDGDYRVKLPKGAHTIEVEDIGQDWIMASYSFVGCVESDRPPLRCWGLVKGSEAIAWVQNTGSTWKALARKEKLTPCAPSRVWIPAMIGARARVELWDTWNGKPLVQAKVEIINGQPWIHLPEIERDIAIRIIRESR